MINCEDVLYERPESKVGQAPLSYCSSYPWSDLGISSRVSSPSVGFATTSRDHDIEAAAAAWTK